MNEQQHEMVLEKTHPSGVDEWYCPTCGRRLLMDYGPKFKKTVLETGDEHAVHSGGKGGLQIGSLQVTSVDDTLSKEEDTLTIDDPSLTPWAEWLDKVDFESRWNSKD